MTNWDYEEYVEGEYFIGYAVIPEPKVQNVFERIVGFISAEGRKKGNWKKTVIMVKNPYTIN